MKKLCSLLIILFTINSIMAQSPQLMNFQGVARNSVGNVLSNKNITVRLSIHNITSTGPVLYSETRAITTNAFGLFNIVIGSAGATSTIGGINTINWLVNNKYLQLEIDPLGGSAFTNIGTTQLVSVPYAFSAGQALPSGPAGGSLTGSFPNPSIGTGVVTAANLAAGVIPTTLPPSGAAGGSLVGTYPNPTLGTGVVNATNIAAGVIPTTLPPSGAAGGDLSGTYPNPALTTTGVAAGTYGDALNYSKVTIDAKGRITNATQLPLPVGLPATGPAGGDLSGTYPNPSLLIPLTKTSAQTGNSLINLTNTATTGTLGALQASSASTDANAVALQGTISSSTPGGYSTAVRGVNNGTAGNGIGVWGSQAGNGYGVYGTTAYGSGVFGNSTTGTGVYGNTSTGFAGSFNATGATGIALLTNGAVQHTGIGEGLGKVLTSDAAGNATWQNLPAGTGITGSGTLNYLPKFTPSGTVLGNSQVFDDASGVGIGTATPTYKLDVLNGGGTGIRSKSSSNFSVMDIDATNGDAALRFLKAGAFKWNTRNRPTDDFYEIYQGGGGSRMVISQAGDVGINQSTPTAKLHVNGSSDASQTLGAYSFDHQGLIVQNASAATTKTSRAVIGYAANSTIENHALFGYAQGTGSSYNTGIFALTDGVTSGKNFGLFTNVSNSTNSNVGIQATVPNGANDYAAILNGKVRIADGTQAPGKVLTSDVVGNASWQDQNSQSVGISVRSFTGATTIPNSINTPLINWATILNEDGGANFNATTGEYTITKAGTYQINGSILWNPIATVAPTGYCSLRLKINGLYETEFASPLIVNTYGTNTIATSRKLNIGDKISFEVYQTSGANMILNSGFYAQSFSVQYLHK